MDDPRVKGKPDLDSLFDDSSTRYSVASNYTQQTSTTFKPPGFASEQISSANFKSLDTKRPSLVVLEDDDLIPDKDIFYPKKRKRPWLIAVIVLLLVVVGGGVGAFVLVGLNNADGDFCAGFGVTDEEVRSLIAAEFDNAVTNNQATFRIEGLECMPSNAFGALSAAQEEVLRNQVTDLIFSGFALQNSFRLVNADAFPDDLVGNINRFGFPFCGLEALPDGVLRNFESMTQLLVNGNPMVTLSNDLFNGRSNSLQQLFIGFNSVMTEFPLAMQFMPNLIRLFVDEAFGIVDANAEAFEGLSQDFILIFRQTPPPVLQNLGISGLAAALNLLENQIDNQGNPVPP